MFEKGSEKVFEKGKECLKKEITNKVFEILFLKKCLKKEAKKSLKMEVKIKSV